MQQITPTTQAAYQNTAKSDKQTNALECTSGYAEKLKWGCITAGSSVNCSWTTIGYEYVTYCVYKDEEVIDEIDNSDGTQGGGGYIPPIHYDCNGDENGVRIIMAAQFAF